MRYTSSPPHAFRHRIAKSIGVLVAAALVATLGLPTAAQAQAIDMIEITSPDSTNEGLEGGMEPSRGSSPTGGAFVFNRWIVTFTEPGTGDEWLSPTASSARPAPPTDDVIHDV